MARILWISDAGTTTGFSKVTHQIGERLVARGHEVHVLAIGWDAPYPVETPLKLYRAGAGSGRHNLGFDRVVELLNRVEPDVVVVVEDPATLYSRLFENRWDPDRQLLQQKPILAYLPVDGVNLPPAWAKLTEAVNVVAMSEHGRHLLDPEGIHRVPVVYHGVEDIFHPVEPSDPIETTGGMKLTKASCREAFNIPQDAFVIGRVDTNSGRKDYPATWKVIDSFLRFSNRPADVVTVFHTKREPTSGVNLSALISRSSDIKSKWLVTDSAALETNDVVALMNTFDVFLTTSRGEGFGLGIAEALACGIPVIATDFSAMSEVVGPGGLLVEGTHLWTTPLGHDLMHANTAAMTEQLLLLARNPSWREDLGLAGIEHVQRNFNWDRAGDAFNAFVEALAARAAENGLLNEPTAAGV